MLKIFDWFADLITYKILSFEVGEKFSEAVHFFFLDTSKIFVLLLILIYIITFIRSFVDEDKVRLLLSRKNRFIGYIGASLLGAITPFCSCSSIPLFMTFLRSGVPFGVAMAFLIVSPIINEVAIILLAGVLGVEFTLIYLIIGVSLGVIGGAIFDFINAKRFLMELPVNQPCGCSCDENGHKENEKITMHNRHKLALEESLAIFKSIWIYILIGVTLGAIMHGYLPENFIEKYVGKDNFWSVPAAVLVGIPLYTGSTSAIPVVQSLIAKGLPIGTAMAFMMSSVGASLPEFMILKRVMKAKLLIIVFIVMLIFFTLAGFLFNAYNLFMH